MFKLLLLILLTPTSLLAQDCPELSGTYAQCRASLLGADGKEHPFGASLPESIEISLVNGGYHVISSLADEMGPYQQQYSIIPDGQKRLEDQIGIKIFRHSYCNVGPQGPLLTTIAIERDKANKYTILGYKTAVTMESAEVIKFMEYGDFLGPETSVEMVEESQELLSIVRCKKRASF